MSLTATTTGYTLLVADDPAQVSAAQRLRHRVFADELGATLHSSTDGLDVDEFDAHCDHLIVRDDTTGEVVGTYRMLPPGRIARRYADGEFDLSALDPLRDMLVETGRSCVHPDHRSGAVINLMWAGIARYLHLKGHRWLGGCASVGLEDGGVTAAGVWNLARTKHLSPPAMRVRPHRPWLADMGERSGAASPGPERSGGKASPQGAAGASEPVGTVEPPARVAVPPLLRGYLRLGAWVCGPPAYDPDFGCADLYVLLSVDRVDPRYLRHFLGDPGS